MPVKLWHKNDKWYSKVPNLENPVGCENDICQTVWNMKWRGLFTLLWYHQHNLRTSQITENTSLHEQHNQEWNCASHNFWIRSFQDLFISQCSSTNRALENKHHLILLPNKALATSNFAPLAKLLVNFKYLVSLPPKVAYLQPHLCEDWLSCQK